MQTPFNSERHKHDKLSVHDMWVELLLTLNDWCAPHFCSVLHTSGLLHLMTLEVCGVRTPPCWELKYKEISRADAGFILSFCSADPRTTANDLGERLPNIAARQQIHDDVIKWKHFSRYWPFVPGIHRSPLNSPHKGQWSGALMFSLICASNKRLSKQSRGWWFETPSCSLWRNCYVIGDLRAPKCKHINLCHSYMHYITIENCQLSSFDLTWLGQKYNQHKNT